MFNGLLILASVVAALLAGCGSKETREDWPQIPTTVVQFCVTNPSATDSYRFSNALVYADGEPASMGSTDAYPVGFTQTGQSVFQGYGAIPPTVLRAVFTRRDGGPRHVYYPPTSGPKDEWTVWKDPDFASDDYYLMFKVQQERQPNVEKRPPSADAPKVRFRQKTHIEHDRDLESYRKGHAIRDIPPC